MKITIFCDQIEQWNYDTCQSCRRFTVTKSDKGISYTCSLNKKSASQKRIFYSIWAVVSLRDRGIDIPEDEIVIEYVGKRKPKQTKGNDDK